MKFNISDTKSSNTKKSLDILDNSISEDEFLMPKNIVVVGNEQVHELNINSLVSFKDNPFKVLIDKQMKLTEDSIHSHGLLVPIIVRPLKNKCGDDRYEILSGHRRVHICKNLGYPTISAIIKDTTDEEAILILVDSNIERSNLLISEKAFAYKYKLNALHMYRNKSKLNKGYVRTRDNLDSKSSGRNVQRYIRLTYLIPELLSLVDRKKIQIGAGVDIAFMSTHDQYMLFKLIKKTNVMPNALQAKALKINSENNSLTECMLQDILINKKNIAVQITLKKSTLDQYFDKGESKSEIEFIILNLLSEWKEKNR